MLIYHCAFRAMNKPSKISVGAAQRKKCRSKWNKKPCRYSFVIDDGKVEDKK